jgi:hypothetical protein
VCFRIKIIFDCPSIKPLAAVLVLMIFALTDGKTFGNDCERQQAMVSKAHNGRCK